MNRKKNVSSLKKSALSSTKSDESESEDENVGDVRCNDGVKSRSSRNACSSNCVNSSPNKSKQNTSLKKMPNVGIKSKEEKQDSNAKRKVFKTYKNARNNETEINGFARCLTATCNFISSDMRNIQIHYKNCNGVPRHDKNFCSKCECYMATAEEFQLHKGFCKDKNKLIPSNHINDGSNNVESSNKINRSECRENYTKVYEGTSNGNDEIKHVEEPNENSHTEPCMVSDNNSESQETEQGLGVNKGNGSPSGKRQTGSCRIWQIHINRFGYAFCRKAQCNFMSSKVSDLENHTKVCDGVAGSNFVCSKCKNRLPSKKDLSSHEVDCKGDFEIVTQKKLPVSRKKCANQKRQETVDCEDSVLDNMSPPYEETENAFGCPECKREFPTEKHFSIHKCINQNKKVQPKDANSLHFRNIEKLKDGKTDEDHIVQPGPNWPEGEYRRRRSYKLQHKNVWISSLQKYKYVKCFFQNCYFIAMSLEDMISHFGYCNGDGSFAKFECPHCKGRVTSKDILLKHIKRSHGSGNIDSSVDGSPEENMNSIDGENCDIRNEETQPELLENLRFNDTEKSKSEDEDYIVQPRPRCAEEMHRLRRSYRMQHKNAWISALEKYRYVRCVFQNCHFIAMSLDDMIFHFGFCDGDGSFAKFECPHCKGRVTSEDVLLKHIKWSHSDESVEEMEVKEEPELEKSGSQPTHEADSNKGKQDSFCRNWQKEIKRFGYAFCRNGQCNFMSANISDLETHFKICDGIADLKLFCCSKCGHRLPTKKDLSQHEVTCAGGSESPIKNKSKETKEVSSNSGKSHSKSGSTNHKSKSIKMNSKHQIMNSETSSKTSSSEQSVSQETMRSEELKKESETTTITEQILDREGVKNKKMKENVEATAEVEQIIDKGFVKNRKMKEDLGRTTETEKKIDKGAIKGGKVNLGIKRTTETCRENETDLKPTPKKRGRKPKTKVDETNDLNKNDSELEIKCGKCGFTGTEKNYKDHNLRKHYGLGWVDGEEPVDMSDEKNVVRLVKAAFRVTNKGKCEVCQDVKKSVLGFVSHIQNCGKTAQERDAIKVQCPHCPARCLKYSLPVHIKLIHSENPEKEEKSEAKPVEEANLSGKRRSALRAVTKFQDILMETDETEEVKSESNYVYFEKSKKQKLPKLCVKLSHLWYRLKREKKKIPCFHPGCENVNEEVQEARQHHFSCPQLPEKVYMCERCDYYTVEKPEIESHMLTHKEKVKQKKQKVESDVKEATDDEVVSEDEDSGDEDEEDISEGEDADLETNDADPKKRKRKRKLNDVGESVQKKKKVKYEGDDEMVLKQNFFNREKISNIRGTPYYERSLNHTLKSEMEVQDSQVWPELNTEAEDWCQVQPEVVSSYQPVLKESISVKFTKGGDEKTSWRRFKCFEGDLSMDVPTIFTGGSVRSMSWCKISVKRMLQKNMRQYLALSTSTKLDNSINIQERSRVPKPNLLQIWDCGDLGTAQPVDKPKLSLGLIQEGGEIWDLTWFPEDTSSEGSGKTLSRLGLLATASEDGAVRVFSICDPSQLVNNNELPLYTTQPLVKLIADGESEENCFRVSVGKDGMIAGGYSNGILAVWNINNMHSPFTKKEEKCRIIRAHLVIQGHKCSITALTFCPYNSRFISTGALDKTVKLWDLQSPQVPFEQYSKELCLDNFWPKNWPLIIYNLDEVVVNHHKGFIKFIKDVFSDRHQPCLLLNTWSLSLSFSDWFNALCASNVLGDIKIKFLRNFMNYEKIKMATQHTISTLNLQKLTDEKTEEESIAEFKNGLKNCRNPKTYEELNSTYGLVFKDAIVIDKEDKEKSKKCDYHPEEFRIRTVNKVSFNPNIISFMHLAVGYNCGFVRILNLKDLCANKSVKKFLHNTQKQFN